MALAHNRSPVVVIMLSGFGLYFLPPLLWLEFWLSDACVIDRVLDKKISSQVFFTVEIENCDFIGNYEVASVYASTIRPGKQVLIAQYDPIYPKYIPGIRIHSGDEISLDIISNGEPWVARSEFGRYKIRYKSLRD